MRCIRTLHVNQQRVVPRVPVKAGHHGKIGFERFALAVFEGFHELRQCAIAERFGLIGIHCAPPWERAPRLRGCPRLLHDFAIAGAVELGHSPDADLGNRLLGSAVLAGAGRVFARTDLSIDLHTRALGQLRGVLAGMPESDAAVPGRFGLIAAGFAILPAPFGCEREHRERRLILAVADLGIAAQKSNKCYPIAVHMRFLLFLLPRSLGAPESERNRSQGQDLLFRGTATEPAKPYEELSGGAETRQGRADRKGEAEAEDRSAAGRG